MVRVKTPCIGVCSTGIGDNVCRGCKRFAHEVIHWNSYAQTEQQIIIDRLDNFIRQIVSNKIDIFDPVLLRQQMHYQHIQGHAHLSPERWLYELLRQGASQIESAEAYGFRLKPRWQRFSLEEMKQFLEQDFYALSCAHYERYFSVNRPC